MAWQDDLQPASWNGVPFFVDAGQTRAGRNTAVHPYPFRATSPVWVEDLGLAPFTGRISGFLIGDDVSDQMAAMLDAVQQEGQGELVHPMHGSLTGSIVGGCSFDIRKDRGRYVEIGFEFIQNEQSAPYPDAQPDTQAGVQDAGVSAEGAVASDYMSNTGIPGSVRESALQKAAAGGSGTTVDLTVTSL